MTALKAFVAAAVLAAAGSAVTIPVPALAQSGPSFNCARARTFVEKAICRSPTLSAKDRRMSRMYFHDLATTQQYGEADDVWQLKEDQRLWLARRDRCQTVGCLQAAYDQRIEELTDLEDQ
jgi:uncharacterized protein